MANGYGMGYEQINQNQLYPQQQYQQVYNQNYGRNVLGSLVTTAAVGFAGGTAVTAGIDYFKNRKPVNGGEVSDTFAQKVLDKIIKKDYVAKGKEFFKQKADVLKNIDLAKTPEKFRKLMKKNKEFCKTLCDGISLDTMCDTVTKENIKEKISAIKQRTQASLKTEIQNIKDLVKLCWDSENKKFVKPDSVDNKLFKIIKNTNNSINWKKACKYGGITAAILSILVVVPELMANRNK